MRKNIFRKIVIILVALISFISLTFAIYATDDTTVEFKASDNKIINSKGEIIPLLLKEDIPEYSEKTDNFIFKLRNAVLPRKYDLREDGVNVEVYDQGKTSNCWIYSINSMLETTRAKESNEYVKYDVAYTDKESAKIYNRKENGGGTPSTSLNFYTCGYGPLTVSTQKIDTQIGNYVNLASVFKSKDSNGNKIYNSGNYTESQVLAMRENIKKHIKTYGAVSGAIYGSDLECFNYNQITGDCSYFCDYNYINADHQVTIIGWDDDYSKENFNAEHRPTSNGAYIVLNSWGKENFTKDGCFYVSYEDTYIESFAHGVTDVEQKEYDKLYQTDETGSWGALLSPEVENNYGANIFKRENSSAPEILTEVSVANTVNSAYEIYVNPNGKELDFNKLKKVATTEVLPVGFHTIELEDELLLTGTDFAVVVKYINNIDGKVYYGTEFSYPNTVCSTAKINQGESYVYSEEGWIDLTTVANQAKNELKYLCNLSIKAFTKNYEDKIAPTITNVTMTPEGWTNGKVTLSVNGAKDNFSTTEEIQYSFDGGKSWQKSSSKEYDQITKDIEIWVKDAKENIYKHAEKINITKIDKLVPTLEVTNNTETSKLKATIIIKVQDEENGSGIKSVTVNGIEVNLANNEIEYIAKSNGKYTVIVMDNAGNSTTKEIEISNITATTTSTKYRINNEYIFKIPVNTNKKTFFENLTISIENKEVYEADKAITDEGVLKTGMKLKITEGEESLEYILAVIGDSTEDGKVDARDLIDSVKQYKYERTNGAKGKRITGANLLAIKFAEDEKYTALDLIGEVKKYKEMKIH